MLLWIQIELLDPSVVQFVLDGFVGVILQVVFLSRNGSGESIDNQCGNTCQCVHLCLVVDWPKREHYTIRIHPAHLLRKGSQVVLESPT